MAYGSFLSESTERFVDTFQVLDLVSDIVAWVRPLIGMAPASAGAMSLEMPLLAYPRQCLVVGVGSQPTNLEDALVSDLYDGTKMGNISCKNEKRSRFFFV